MGQHSNSWRLGFDLVNRLKFLGVGDTIDHGCNLSFETIPVLDSTLTCSDFNFPTWVEKVRTREDDVGVMQN